MQKGSQAEVSNSQVLKHQEIRQGQRYRGQIHIEAQKPIIARFIESLKSYKPWPPLKQAHAGPKREYNQVDRSSLKSKTTIMHACKTRGNGESERNNCFWTKTHIQKESCRHPSVPFNGYPQIAYNDDIFYSLFSLLLIQVPFFLKKYFWADSLTQEAETCDFSFLVPQLVNGAKRAVAKNFHGWKRPVHENKWACRL